jgi:Methyltransferase domain
VAAHRGGPLARRPGVLRPAAIRLGARSREAKWRLYCRSFPPRPGERVLDVGASAQDDLPNENYFLRRYPRPEQLTAVGVSDLGELGDRYPQVRFERADGRALPFDDGAFDVVHSNAVVEHVGPREEQERFVAELTRVGRAGLVTTPNRWFPAESHTRVLLAHWLPRDQMLWTMSRLGRIAPDADWPVWLLSPRAFRGLFPSDLELRLFVNRVAGLPATLNMVFRRGCG